MPKQINSPFPGSSLVRAFNLKGRFQPVLDEVVVPVALVTDLTGLGTGSGVREAGGTNYNTSAVATSAYACLNNPLNSGVRITVAEAHFKGTVLTAGATVEFVYGDITTYVTDDTGILTPGAAYTNEGTSFLDARIKATQPLGTVIAGNPRQVLPSTDLIDYDIYAWANVAATAQAAPAPQFHALEKPVILSPGFSLCINVIHLGAFAFHDSWSFTWREESLAGGQP